MRINGKKIKRSGSFLSSAFARAQQGGWVMREQDMTSWFSAPASIFVCGHSASIPVQFNSRTFEYGGCSSWASKLFHPVYHVPAGNVESPQPFVCLAPCFCCAEVWRGV